MFCCCQRNETSKVGLEEDAVINERLLAAQFGDIEGLQSLCQNSRDINMADSNGISPLHAAVIGSQPDVVGFLLGMGADPDHRCKLGRTPLHNACARSTARVAELLLEAQPANINDPAGDSGGTALDFAIDWSRKDIQELLISKGGKTASELRN